MSKDFGMLHESGDRWKLDLLIPNRDRLLVGPQIQRTSKPRVATKAVRVTDYTIHPSLRVHMPIHSAIETGLELQARLRRRFSGDEALPGDRLL